MSSPNEILKFTGDETPEEAEKWIGTLVASTGSYTNSGLFRLIQSKFPLGSISRAWFDDLDDIATTTWKVFEPNFYDRWITSHAHREWEAFKYHTLPEAMIFGKDPDVQVAHERICSWVDDHLQLGRSVRREDKALITATKQLLPPFIRAYLKAFVKVEPQSFEALCDEIKGVTEQILDYELTRRGFSSTEWSSVIEKHILQVSEKVDKLIMAKGGEEAAAHDRFSFINPTANRRNQPITDAVSSTESPKWEESSPLTSVLGVSTSSGASTPVAQSNSQFSQEKHAGSITKETSDPETANPTASPGNPMLLLYSIPETWRKPVCLKRRDELIIIAQRAIDFIENYRSKFTIKWCQRRNFLSAIAIRDKLIESRRYIDTEPFSGSGDDSLYDHLMLAQSRVYRYYAYEIDWYRNQPVKDWAEHIESDDSTKTIIKADVYKIRISDTDHHLHLTPSGVPSLVGGVFAPGLKKGGAFVSSVRTVLFMTLSSYLAEMTGERKYTDIATLGANCIKTWMMDSTTRLIKDCLIDAQTAQERSGAELSCHLTGVVIEGLTVLASVSGEDSWRMLAIEIARAAMCYEPWHSSDGILTLSKDRATSENTNNKTFKGLLNRGLLVAYERNRLNEPFCNMVRCYINVQFNALYELSRIQNAYGMDWRGPYAGPYAHAQIAAFDTIVAALGVSEG